MNILRTIRLACALIIFQSGFLSAQQDTAMVFFPVSSDQIDKENSAYLQNQISNIPYHRIESVMVLGYCDDTGSEIRNTELSELRAQALYEALLNHDISSELFREIQGQGSIPIENLSGDITAKRQENRKAIAVFNLAPEAVEIVEVMEVKSPKMIRDSVRVGDKIKLEKVIFVGGKREIVMSSAKAIQTLVDELRERPELHIRIEGHVCCTPPNTDGVELGTKKKNLSELRAKSVYDLLISRGIEAERLEFVGMKGDYPLGGDPALDRRVEIVISKGAEPKKD